MTYYQIHHERLLSIQREYYIKHREDILRKVFERNVLRRAGLLSRQVPACNIGTPWGMLYMRGAFI